MSKSRIIAAIVVLILIVSGVVWLAKNNKVSKPQNGPVLSVTSFNRTKNLDATATSAEASDEVEFTLNAENHTDSVISGYVIEVNVAEVLDKSTLLDAQGAGYNSATNSLVWTPLDIPAQGLVQKQFVVRVNQVAPNATSTVMKIIYNNELKVSIKAPKAAVSGSTTDSGDPYQAPKTGPQDFSVLLAGLTTVLVFGIRKLRVNKI